MLENRKAAVGASLWIVFILRRPHWSVHTSLPTIPTQIGVGSRWNSPSAQHWLGTTQLGQDLFSQLLVGTRRSLMVGLLVGILTTLIAIVIGITAGYLGGWLDDISPLYQRLPDPAVLPTVIVAAVTRRPSTSRDLGDSGGSCSPSRAGPGVLASSARRRSPCATRTLSGSEGGRRVVGPDHPVRDHAQHVGTGRGEFHLRRPSSRFWARPGSSSSAWEIPTRSPGERFCIGRRTIGPAAARLVLVHSARPLHRLVRRGADPHEVRHRRNNEPQTEGTAYPEDARGSVLATPARHRAQPDVEGTTDAGVA